MSVPLYPPTADTLAALPAGKAPVLVVGIVGSSSCASALLAERISDARTPYPLALLSDSSRRPAAASWASLHSPRALPNGVQTPKVEERRPAHVLLALISHPLTAAVHPPGAAQKFHDPKRKVPIMLFPCPC